MVGSLRRLFLLSLAAAFFVGATVQLLPLSVALADMGVHSDKMAGCDEPAMPPAKPMPNCVDHCGCLTVQVLPTSPALLAAPVQWVVVAYASGVTPLQGQSVPPELTPPIPSV